MGRWGEKGAPITSNSDGKEGERPRWRLRDYGIAARTEGGKGERSSMSIAINGPSRSGSLSLFHYRPKTIDFHLSFWRRNHRSSSSCLLYVLRTPYSGRRLGRCPVCVCMYLASLHTLVPTANNGTWSASGATIGAES